jgi:hypothetical protein
MGGRSDTELDPNWMGRHRLWKQFNEANGGFTNAFRIADFDRMLGGFPLIDGVQLEGWFQYDENLTALYALGDTLVLLERFEFGDEMGYVACVGGQSWDDVSAVVGLLIDTQQSLGDLWDEVSESHE